MRDGHDRNPFCRARRPVAPCPAVAGRPPSVVSCEKRSDEAIQNLAAALDCFASLAMTRHSRGAIAPEFCQASPKQALPTACPEKIEGGGAPVGALFRDRANGRGCPLRILPHLPGRTRRGLASRRSTAALATPMKAMAQPQAALRAIHVEQRRYLRLGPRSQRCTSHAGHCAGWSMPRDRPGAGLRAPPAGTALAPLQGPSREASLD